MLRLPFVLLLLVAVTPGRAEERVLFEDDFERNESQEKVDEVGKGWGTNSASRAAGNKQVDLRDGAMYVTRHEVADHGVSVKHDAGFRNGSVELRFLLEDAKDGLGLNFADLKLKTVHAGHLFVAKIDPRSVQLTDLKTGNMDLEVRKARLAKKVTPELEKRLKTKTARFPHRTTVGEWHTLRVDVDGETLTATVDGRKIGSFTSPGIAHPTKRTLRLAVPRAAVVDDVRILAR